MSLSAGEKLGPYEVLTHIGEGGMGEVWQARDSRLNRIVAIKKGLKPFNERFEREAHAIAALNHPHICSLYDVGPDFLVMEYVDGQPLKGPLPLDQALEYARQILDALDAAHRKGIIHRDLKPGNILVNKAGVKLLDFGLAKTAHSPAPDEATVTTPITSDGTILGTLQYMSPEQIEGKEADARSDIFAFGLVFYEMLTGKRAFEGGSKASIIASILKEQARPVSELAPVTPKALDRVVQTCLEKDPDKRWQSARDVKHALDLMSVASPAASAPRGAQAHLLPWAVAALFFLAASALALVHFGEKASVPATVRFDIPQPENFLFGQFIRVSPDGRNLVYATRSAGGAVQLWVRPLETGDSRPLEGTENTNVAIGGPFWSPDSRFIAFAAQGKLKKIEASGGPAQTLCDIQGQFLGGSWARDDKIVFGSLGSGGLVQVSAAGGAPSPLTTLDRSHQETGHGFPSFLPDGRHFFYVRATNPTVGGIFLGSIDAKPEQDSKRLLPDWSGPVYAQSSQPGLGYVLFVRAGTLMAQRFDTGKLAQIGDAFPIAERVANNGFSASDTGVLAYRTATGGGNTQFTWFDREGKVLGTAGEPGLYAVGSVSISPDGARLAAARTEGGNTDVWTLDFTRGMDTRFTFDPGTDVGPIWSPDGGRITYAATRGGKLGLYQKASNGAGQDELLLETTDLNASTSWSRDGRFVLYWGGTPNHVFVLSLPDAAAPGSPGAGKRKGIPIVKSEFNERGARFSPDGRFFSYVSNESGKDEIYVRPFDPANPSAPPGAKWMVSKGGGDGAHWRGDGKEIFYLGPGGNMTAVDVTTSTAGGTPVFQSGVPKVLFKEPSPVPFWDVTADGKKFLLQAPVRDAVSAAFKVVLNWEAGLKK